MTDIVDFKDAFVEIDRLKSDNASLRSDLSRMREALAALLDRTIGLMQTQGWQPREIDAWPPVVSARSALSPREGK